VSYDFHRAESLEQAVGEAVGAGSACWENLRGAGGFQIDKALEVVDALVEWINARYEPKEGVVYDSGRD
jgi:hypothetical protein